MILKKVRTNHMTLDQEAIDEFKKIYLHEYGIELTDAEAIDYGLRLINLIKVVYGEFVPKPKNLK